MGVPFEIPLKATPQKLSITLAGVDYQMSVVWNASSFCWVADFASSEGVPIVAGVPFVTNADLFEQFKYLDLGGELRAQTDHAVTEPPTFLNLGVDGHLYFVANA